MAITKVGTYRNPPEDITDYEAIVAHLEAYTRQIGNQGMILTEWTNHTTAPKIAMGSYISHGGVLYVVDTEDYVLPALSSDGTYYLRVATSGDTLALDYITNLTGYVWNAIYNGLYHSDGKQVLPYQVVKNGALVEKWKITNLMQGSGFSRVRYDGALAVTGAISGESLTGPKTVDHNNETNIANGFSGGTLHLNYRGATAPITELIINDGMYGGATAPIRCAGVDTGYGVNFVYRSTYVNYGTNLQTPSIIMDAMEIGEYRYVTAHYAPQGGDKALFLPSVGSYVRIGSINVYTGGSTLDTASGGVQKSMAHLVMRIS